MNEAVVNPVGLLASRKGRLSVAVDTLRARILEHPIQAFAILTAFHVTACALVSSLKLLWLDELITLHIARLPSVSAIWAALREGADPNPPITHILVHASRALFGEHEFALRLPAVCGYWLGMLFLFAYLRRRLPADWALAGTVLSMTMAAFDFSFESRSYAIFYGFTMAAFYCWTLAVDQNVGSNVRRLNTVAMALLLMACISTNYFAALAFLPISAGEIARTARMFARQPAARPLSHRLMASLDLRIWLGIGLAATPLLAYRPMISHSVAQFAPHAWNRVSITQVTASYAEMVEATLYPLLALFLFYGVFRAIAWTAWRSRGSVRPSFVDRLSRRLRSPCPVLPVHEAVGVFFLMAYPLMGYIVASVYGGMMSPRFVIPVCLGFAMCGIVISFRLFGDLPRAGVTLLIFCLSWFVARESYVGYSYAEQQQCFYNVLNRIPQALAQVPPGAPIAVPDPLMALTLQHYAPPAISMRLAFPVDFPAIRKFRRDDSPEQNMWPVRQSLYKLRVMPLADFQSQTTKYLILASERNWLLQDLDRHHYDEQRLPIDTHADAIGGFTPLMHGLPAFYVGSGALQQTGPLSLQALPIPFRADSNLPEAPDLQ